MTKIEQFTFNPFQENTFVIYDETKKCVIIDPGCYEKHEETELSNFISENGLEPVYLLNTHSHVDHVLGNFFVKNKYNIPVVSHKLDEPIMHSVKAYAPSYGFTNYTEAGIDQFVEEGDKITFGNTSFEVLFVPGHAPGHIAFYCEKENFCIAGDTLFQMSIGRADLPGGDYNTLINSIHSRLFTLNDATTVYPGHGGETTIAYEKKNNPYCKLS